MAQREDGVRRREGGRVDGLQGERRVDRLHDEVGREEVALAGAEDVVRRDVRAAAYEGKRGDVNFLPLAVVAVERRVDRHVRARDEDLADVRELVAEVARLLARQHEVAAIAHEGDAVAPRAARDFPAEVAVRDDAFAHGAVVAVAEKRHRRVRVLRDEKPRRREFAVHREGDIAFALAVNEEVGREIERDGRFAVIARDRPVLGGRAPHGGRGIRAPHAGGLRREFDERVAPARHLRTRKAGKRGRVAAIHVLRVFERVARVHRGERLSVRVLGKAGEGLENEILHAEGIMTEAIVVARGVSRGEAIARVEEGDERTAVRGEDGRLTHGDRVRDAVAALDAVIHHARVARDRATVDGLETLGREHERRDGQGIGATRPAVRDDIEDVAVRGIHRGGVVLFVGVAVKLDVVHVHAAQRREELPVAVTRREFGIDGLP